MIENILADKSPARSMRRRCREEFLKFLLLSSHGFDLELEYIRPIVLLNSLTHNETFRPPF